MKVVIMICGGHASKAHLKVFEKYSKSIPRRKQLQQCLVNCIRASSLK